MCSGPGHWFIFQITKTMPVHTMVVMAAVFR
jgi:hypothetical protein